MKRLFALAMSLGLVAVLAVPAMAGGAHNKATGSVDWDAQYGANPGLTTVFDVHADAPGQASAWGDRGTLTHYHPTKGMFVLNVECAKVESTWAEFAGLVVEATGSYSVGDAYLWSVVDGGTPGSDGDEIGGTKISSGLTSACNQALDGTQRDNQGIINDGNIVVHFEAE